MGSFNRVFKKEKRKKKEKKKKEKKKRQHHGKYGELQCTLDSSEVKEPCLRTPLFFFFSVSEETLTRCDSSDRCFLFQAPCPSVC